ncbi:MAG: hypothetical protein ACD_42C00043G0002 [uncultured bacterium]|nr:MAG: hypothetical protein ACD_42C00043G0002 [uncultured bacterium]
MMLSMIQKFKKGQIWLANLNPNKGAEPGKTRPVLILQDQTLLDVVHPTTVIIPLTTNIMEDVYPLRVRVLPRNQLKKESDLLIDQIRAIDNKRLINGPLLSLNHEQMQVVYRAVSEVIGAEW